MHPDCVHDQSQSHYCNGALKPSTCKRCDAHGHRVRITFSDITELIILWVTALVTASKHDYIIIINAFQYYRVPTLTSRANMVASHYNQRPTGMVD